VPIFDQFDFSNLARDSGSVFRAMNIVMLFEMDWVDLQLPTGEQMNLFPKKNYMDVMDLLVDQDGVCGHSNENTGDDTIEVNERRAVHIQLLTDVLVNVFPWKSGTDVEIEMKPQEVDEKRVLHTHLSTDEQFRGAVTKSNEKRVAHMHLLTGVPLIEVVDVEDDWHSAKRNDVDFDCSVKGLLGQSPCGVLRCGRLQLLPDQLGVVRFGTSNVKCLEGCVCSDSNPCSQPQELMGPQLLVVTTKLVMSIYCSPVDFLLHGLHVRNCLSWQLPR